MNIHIQPTQATCRVYGEKGSYESKTPYEAVFTITFLWDNSVFLHAAHGKINLKVCQEIVKKLQSEYGIKTAYLERHGKVITLTADKFKLKE